MLATMDTLMGGRAAEELIFGSEKITSGASSDLRQATALATNMVKEWGMSEKVGVRTFEEDHNSLIVVNELSPNTSEIIDTEIKRILHVSSFCFTFFGVENILEQAVVASFLLSKVSHALCFAP
ncbi:hypothetical protein HPB47_014767 [Ixodes persulcatus]|uniref:Uncharacterized protein n=1 Tax=Ixodes persulcatus TaxID=34615 RepID=A0AC60R0L7_IXOPE|nr:hypothetical protein HPB47_014767 [Ixodes persulcatus]